MASDPAPPPLFGVVEESTSLSPSMRRVVLGGAGLDTFEPSPFTDQYVNGLFIPDGAPYTVPFDVTAARGLEPQHRPRGRRLTVRRWSSSERRLTLDVAVHGDIGYAGRWAHRAAKGDRLQLTGPSGSYAPDPTADWFLLAGDESALPAIAASLADLPPSASATVFALVDSPDHEVDLEPPAGAEVTWLHRAQSTSPEQLLVEAIRQFAFPSGRPDVFVHGEASETRSVRYHLAAERGLDRASASISPYWRRDHTDEAWRETKRAFLADQENELAAAVPPRTN